MVCNLLWHCISLDILIINMWIPGGKTALMLAAYHGHSHVITTLMELGCDWQRLDNAGCTGQLSTHYINNECSLSRQF